MKTSTTQVSQVDEKIADFCAEHYGNPYEWVMAAFAWDEGDLLGFDGPDEWQVDFLKQWGDEIRERGFNGVTPVPPIQFGFASGHGIGKSALSAWIILFLMSTRTYCRGIVTANTSDQLKTKTWSELGKWRKLCITGHWFEYNNGKGSMNIYHRSNPETWRVDAQTCREENSESFAGLHAASSTPFYLFDEGCHDDKTEVLTSTGWKLFRNISPDQELLTMDPETHVAEYIKPSSLHVSHRKGVMCLYEKRGASFSVTPNHKMYFRKYNRKQGGFYPYRFAEMSDIKAEAYVPRRIKWVKSSCNYFQIPSFKSARKIYPARSVRTDDWMTFLGWYYSEGSTDKRKNKAGDTEFVAVRITQQDLAEICAICDRLGFKYSIYQSSTPQLCIIDRALAEYLGQFGGNCLEKRVPDYIKNSSADHIDLFLGSFIKGDGYCRGKYDILYTSSKLLADDLQEMCLKAGYSSTLRVRSLKGKVSKFKTHFATSSVDGYVVSRSRTNTEMNIRIKDIVQVDYDGMVYCAELPKHHLLFTRRDGYCMWSGNSAVPDKIYEVAEGGKTDGEPMHFVFGNPTRNTGRFFEIFHKLKHRWITKQIDSRTAKMTNKELIQEWIDDYGDDSDFVRVRVLGRFPRAGDMQFIPHDIVALAAKRRAIYLPNDPLICGIDVARGGEDDNMIQFRRGFDAKSEKAYRIPGEKTRNSMVLISKLCDILDRHQPHAIFLDAGGIGGPIGDRLRQLGYPVFDVLFGENAADEVSYKSRTAEMWGKMRQWLFDGGAIKDHPTLESNLTNREYMHNDKNQLVLERKKDMKARGLDSPDWGDALGLTFAAPVAPLVIKEHETKYKHRKTLTERGLVKKNLDRNVLDRLD